LQFGNAGSTQPEHNQHGKAARAVHHSHGAWPGMQSPRARGLLYRLRQRHVLAVALLGSSNFF